MAYKIHVAALKNLSFFILLFAAAMGVAFQNIAFGIVGVFFILLGLQHGQWSWKALYRYIFPSQFHKQLLTMGLLFIAWNILATILNSHNPNSLKISEFLRYLVGMSFFWLGPCLIDSQYRTSRAELKKALSKLGLLILACMGVIALSQYFWGWRILGIYFSQDILRPRGFSSHPLTFAYATLMFWPFGIQKLLSNPRDLLNWAAVSGMCIILWTTVSRTAQVVALIYVFVYAIFYAHSKIRVVSLGVMLLVLTAIGLSKNSVRDKFMDTFSSVGVDKFSAYPDDRLAFWHAHALMIAERPIIGHGIGLDTEYRTPYYQRIGLGDFNKKYEAHNQILQIAVESGLVGVLLFLSYILLIVRQVLRQRRNLAPEIIGSALGVLAVFLVAGLTQNAFQDSEVRYGLCLLLGFFLSQLYHVQAAD